MDVQGSRTALPGDRRQGPPAPPMGRSGLSPERVGQALGECQRGELRLARSFSECRGLSHEQLEDLYQDTALVLLGRSFHNEEHLRNALRWGIKHRALHQHRDERRRGEILAQRAPELQLAAEGREEDHTPELAAVLAQDRLFVSEFLSELSELERRVFWLLSEGMRYRAIAPILDMEVNEARKAFRSCERKRERFQLLHDTGRLCGYRSHTIQALLSGEGASERLASGAFAHLEACAHCRSEHKTNARRLRRSFQEQAAALLPFPALAGHMGWLTRLDLRARALHQRLLPYGSPPGTGGVRERAIAMVASGGAAVKLAAGAATVAVLAGGTIGATHELQPHRARHHHVARGSVASTSAAERAATTPPVLAAATVSHASASTASAAPSSRPHAAERSASRQPGGFAFLGVPSTTAAGGPRRATASAAVVGSATGASSGGAQRTGRQQAGGPFSP
jgi:RNA polymerase sigma factor (sigma-70 family)